MIRVVLRVIHSDKKMNTLCTRIIYKQGRYTLLTFISTHLLYSYYLQTGSVPTVDIYKYLDLHVTI